MADQFASGRPGEFKRPTLTKIVATLGPASSELEVISRMIEAGVSIFRLNFSHGDEASHLARLQLVRQAAGRLGRPVAVLGDLQGPKIRVGPVIDTGVEAPAGSAVVIQRKPVTAVPAGIGAPLRLSSTYEQLVDHVEPGERLLINDGAIRMLVIGKRRDELECTVTVGGIISSNKGINLPDTSLAVPVLTGRDWQHVEWAISHDLDFLAMSFISTADHVKELAAGIEARRLRLANSTLRMPIIAKIERPAAVQNIEAIAEAADGIMIARGDLGVEMDLPRVPVIQKRLLEVAQNYGKPSIVATQMLESMISSPSPTRAEVSDVAGAIMEGADAVMLSGETAVGRHPALAVDTMARVARYTEEHLASQPHEATPPRKLMESRYRTAALAHGVWTVAHDIGARFIVVWSQQGGGARYLSQMGFHIPIIAVSTDDRALRQMQLLRGVTALRMPLPEGLPHFTRMIDAYLTETNWAQRGDQCVLVAGGPIGRQGVTNSLAIHKLGDPEGGFLRHAE